MQWFSFRQIAIQLGMGMLAIGTLAGAQSRAQSQTGADAASLATDLRGLDASLSDSTDSRAAASLPQAWEVETPERHYSISTGPLRAILTSGRKSRTEEAKQWLDQVATQLEGFAGEHTRPADERDKLNRILARSEFGGAGPPNALERFRDRVRAWINDLLERLFQFAASHPAGSQILFWILLTGTVGFLVLWLVRLWSRDTLLLKLTAPLRATHEARTWEEWLASARKAAAQGDWRQAIHCAYWAGVLRLQDSGALPTDRTHTPREYLKLLTVAGTGGESRESLAALTRELERFWYARRTASQEDFTESLRHLAALGCKVE